MLWEGRRRLGDEGGKKERANRWWCLQQEAEAANPRSAELQGAEEIVPHCSRKASLLVLGLVLFPTCCVTWDEFLPFLCRDFLC